MKTRIKFCKNCHDAKPTQAYAVSENSDDGFSPICKACVTKLNKEACERYSGYLKEAYSWT